ncbi:MAG: hypothetical protein J1F31_06815 [Erysipelotrichales bacterium]|nr:hypothetical protein [Erysipelotrichales bacterium]
MIYNESVSKINKYLDAKDTYNFEVEDYHTYYVADSDVLMHNKCDGGVLDEAQRVYDSFDIDKAYVKPRHTTSTGGNFFKFNANKIDAEKILKDTMRKKRMISPPD